jgi:TatD DNase family protein
VTGGGLFDSHLHLTDGRFRGDLEAVLAAARRAGVVEMVTVGSSPEDAAEACAIAAGHAGIWATAGLHPHEASRFDRDVLAELHRLAGRDEVVAIGETGLDYHYDNSPRDEQRRAFSAQLELAAQHDLPVAVHSREADEDTAGLIREVGGSVRGVLHCFTGGDALLDAALEAGWFVSFSGIVTFGSFDGGHRVARVPAERLLIETDSPYLAPVPERGRRNEPAFLVHTCREVARLRGEEADRIAASTRAAARAFYGLQNAGD